VTFAFRVAPGKVVVPQILAEVLMALVLVVFAFWRMTAVGVNLAGIVTTSAVVTGVLAFSLQETLGNLWGGIQLQLDNTCRIGDWIQVDNVMGQVLDIRWRYMAVATNNGETVIIPNGSFSKGRIMVLARRGDKRIAWRREVAFSVSYDSPPGPGDRRRRGGTPSGGDPERRRGASARRALHNFGDSAYQYVARYWLIRSRPRIIWTDSQVRLHVAATLARHEMEIPYPHRVLTRTQGRRRCARRAMPRSASPRWAGLDLFVPLTDGERDALAGDLADFPFVTGDVIARQGEPADSLFILARGHVAIVDDSAGARSKLATLEAPAYFGEMGLLTGQARGATVIAQGEVLCYRLRKAGFDAILQARPELIEALSQVVQARQAANDATLQSLSAEARAKQAVGSRADLVRRIKGFFAIS
jgi:CRP-like cAMP-binding protein